MGDMGEMKAQDVWKTYLTTDDVAKTLEAAEAGGAQIASPAMPVADLGTQAILTDPTGASVGVWQPGTFPGFTVLAEPGAPTWFELYTRDYAGAVDFYRTIFPLEMKVVSDTDEFRYTTLNAPDVEGELGGIMDAAAFLPDGTPPYWCVYWGVDDTDNSVARVQDLGGSVLMEAADSPYGRLATVTDPAGAQFRVIAPNP
jgi:predicted enzyme related to lactoylglutathione lyase